MQAIVGIILLPIAVAIKGGLVALLWNWFVRDELFPGQVITFELGHGIGIAARFTLLTLHQIDTEDNDIGMAIFFTIFISAYVLLLAVVARALVS
jgi:hypothetical protein